MAAPFAGPLPPEELPLFRQRRKHTLEISRGQDLFPFSSESLPAPSRQSASENAGGTSSRRRLPVVLREVTGEVVASDHRSGGRDERDDGQRGHPSRDDGHRGPQRGRGGDRSDQNHLQLPEP